MPKKIVIPVVVILLASLVLTLVWLLHDKTFALFEPSGFIADEQHRIFILAVCLSLFGLVPVFSFATFVAIKYRAGNTQNDYRPDWNKNYIISAAWWLFLATIIAIFAVVAWDTTHQYDPFEPIKSNVKPINIQVVALRWKWLFIYPDQNIATVNEMAFPEKTPVVFHLTADAPMNSFWIPQLVGQVYAMSGMETTLNMMADHTGTYQGSAAEISGAGFADMRFKAKSMTDQDFESWVQTVKQSPTTLNLQVYNQLAQPSEHTPVTYFGSRDVSLYDTIMMKYMKPAATPTPSNAQANTADKQQMNMADMPGM